MERPYQVSLYQIDMFNKLLYNKDIGCDLTTLVKAYEKFIFMLDIPVESFSCQECPEEMSEGESEENYKDVIECHIADGIDMGNITNMVKGIPENELFGQEPPAESKVKKGVEAGDRTYLNIKAHRDVIANLLENRDDQKALPNTLKKLNSKGKHALPKTEHMKVVHQLIEYINSIATRVPIGFTDLLYEIHLETPISALVPSNNDEAHALLRAYLDSEDDIFSNLSYAQLMFQEFPVISLIVERIRKFLATKFLPKEVSNVLHSMLEFNDSYLRLAYSLDGHEAGVHQQGDVLAEVYPGLPQHSANERFHADKYKDPGEIKNCHKEYPEASGITGGLGHITCMHGITKGYTAMKSGESPALFAKTVFKRLHKKVKAERRVFVYDNCCNFHKHVLRRNPWQSRNWNFVIDRHHFKNHKMCSAAYNMDSYKWMDNINSQVCEQRNNSLRKMAKSLAFMKFSNYIRSLTLYFSYTNMKIKNHI